MEGTRRGPGEQIATIHTSSAPASDYVVLQRSRLQALGTALERIRPRGDVPEERPALAFAPLLLAQIEQIGAALEGLDRDDLPRLVVHGDYRRGNLIFAGDDLVALLDFDRTCHDVRAADLAIALSNLTRSGDRQWEMHPDLVVAFMRKYGELQPLTRAERTGLPTLILGKAAIAALQRLVRFDSATSPERGKRGRKFLKHARRLQWLAERQQIWSAGITHD
jgi:Ser/Thr protein kinase RdoA (MazF antagonist)